MRIVLKISDRCNLVCRYCYCKRDGNRPESVKKNVGIKLILGETVKVLNQSGTGKGHQIVFFGCEPLCEFETLKLLYSKLEKNFPELSYSIVTNGTLLNCRISDWLMENGLFTSVSIDGAQNDHDANRKYHSGTGSYGSIMKNVSNLATRHPKAFSKLVSARMTVTPATVARLLENLRHIENLGFESAGFAIDTTNKTWSERHFEFLKENAVRAAQEFLSEKDFISIPEFSKITQGIKSACRPGIDTITIDKYGRKYVCHRSNSMESVLERQTCMECKARDFCTRCTTRMGIRRPNTACKIKYALMPAFEMLQNGPDKSKNVSEVQNIHRREQTVDRLIEVKGKLYRVPQEVLDKFRVEGKENEISKDPSTQTPGRVEPPLKGNWYELGESDCF